MLVRLSTKLFYLSADSRSLWSVEIEQYDPLSVGEPTKIMDLPDDISRLGFQVAADGQRFLMLRNIPEPMGPGGLPKPKALLMENWYEGLRQRQ